MSLSDYIGTSLSGPIAAMRRQAAILIIAVACALGAIFYGLSAALLALEPWTGAIAARLAIALAFMLCAIAALLLPRLWTRQTRNVVERARLEARALSQDDKLAMILEAAIMGFALSAGRARKPDHGEKRSNGTSGD
jgi:hypothetical protein